MNTEHEQSEEAKKNVRQRLLDAAERLFFQNGYEGTSIRDITQEADCNLAAVNYHFGSKDKLYIEMFRRQMQRNIHRHLEVIERVNHDPNATLEDLIRGLATGPLKALESKDPQFTLTRLMVQEMMNRRLKIHEVIWDIKGEVFNRLAESIRRFHPALTARQTQMILFSIDSLIVHPVVFMEYYPLLVEDITVDEVIEQIVRFAAAGIRGCVKGLEGEA